MALYAGAFFIHSAQKQPMIFLAGYRFCKHQVTGVKTHWRCSTHKNHGCKAKIHTLEDNSIIKCYNIHNH
ncbi:Modifier of mdg4 [Operophtera brumata]|uniref:Modifier of mdg4 n=1 Tax=Operophtera brumata TaxID=104452 RepID=A0A0L7FH36_OPEBR|nr:Modifier of mdg4 [Operophtera brumata]